MSAPSDNQVTVWQDDEGESYWAEGHLDHALFADAVDADLLAVGCGPLGTDERTQVAHVWARPKSPDDDYWLICSADEEGAQPFTKLLLDYDHPMDSGEVQKVTDDE